MYKNFRLVIVAMSAIPFALVGGIAALILRGYSFNVSAGVGFISLFGIAIMSGILFVSRAVDFQREHGYGAQEAALKAAILQLRPRLMTMLLALLGLIPAARAVGIGSDVQRPLATVIVGGLCTAIALGFFAMPSIYAILLKKHDDSRKHIKGEPIESA
jgi:cobalt-zinc-cadmium resistance protein CzcA